MSFFTKPRLICWLLLGIIAGVLFLSYMMNPKRERVLLYFQRNSGELGVEERYIPELSAGELAVSLVTELLLGPIEHTFLRLTDPDVRPRSCFVRGNALYLDLPGRVLTPKVNTPDFHTVYMLLQKSITANCSGIDAVYMYIDGVPAYSGISKNAVRETLINSN